MAEEEEVLLNVKLDYGDSTRKITELKSEIDSLRVKQKALDRTTKEGSLAYEDNILKIKSLSESVREHSKEALNAKKVLDLQNGSLKSMRAEISNLKKAYSEMSQVERESAEGKEMSEKILGLNNALKESEMAYGDNQRSVGDYTREINRAMGSNNKFLVAMQNLSASNLTMGQSFKLGTSSVKTFGAQLLKLLANPVVAVVVGIAGAFLLLYGIFNKMISVIKGNEEQSNRLNKVMQPLKLIGDMVTQAFEKMADVFLGVAEIMTSMISLFLKLIGVQNDLNESTAEYIALEQRKQDLVKNNRTLNELVAKNERDIAEQRAIVADKENSTLEQREQANKKAIELERQILTEKLRIAKEELIVMETISARTKDSTEDLEKLSQAKIKLNNIEREYFEGMRKLTRDSLKVTREYEADQREKAKEAKERANKKIEDLIKLIDTEKSINSKRLTLSRTFQRDSFAISQEYANKEFLLQQDSEKRKLDIQLTGGKISKLAYKNSLEALLLDRKIFNETQAKLNIEEYKRQIDVLEKSEEEQIKIIRESYEVQLQDYYSLMEQMGVAEEVMLANSKAFAIGLAKLQEKEIADIKASSITSTIKDIEEKLSKHYSNDLIKYSDNEIEKTKLLISQSIEKIEIINQENIVRAKAGKELLDTLEEEVKLRISKAKLIQLQATTELLTTEENSEKAFEIKRQALVSELLLYKDNITRKMELENQLAQLTKQRQEEKIANFNEYAGKVSESLTNINNLANALAERESAQFKADSDAKKRELEQRLASGLISQEDYNSQIKRGDEDLAKKQAEIARKQAIREKAIKVFEIGMNIASGIMKAVASSPLTGGLPFSAIVAGIGAVQLGAVLAEPLPKASRGLLLKGNSHAKGGIPIEAEGGEAIINKRSTSMFTPLLSAINQAGGGVSLGNDGGFASRRAEESTNRDLSTSLSNALSKIKIFTAVEDINRGQKQYSKIVDRANY